MIRKIAILIAEDDPQTLKLTKGIIELVLPTVLIHTAANTEEALALFEKYKHDIHSERPQDAEPRRRR